MTSDDTPSKTVSAPETTASTTLTVGNTQASRASEIATKTGKAALKVLVVTWAFSKRTAIDLNERRKRAAANRQARLAELKRQSQIAAFRTVFEDLKANSALINPESWKKIKAYEAAVQGDPAALYAFAENKLVKNLVGYAENRAAFLKLDMQRLSPTHIFETDADDLFTAVGYEHINPTLKAIAAKYKMSNAGNVMAGAILAGRKNMGGAALAMVDSARVGAHNGAAEQAFTHNLRYLIFSKPLAEMNDAQRRYLRYAYRIKFLGLGDESIIGRAIFSLVYSNNNCRSRPPATESKFNGNLHPEFHSNFNHLIWSVSQAAAHLDEIRQQGGLRDTLFFEDDIRSRLSWPDPVPEPGFHLQNTKQG